MFTETATSNPPKQTQPAETPADAPALIQTDLYFEQDDHGYEVTDYQKAAQQFRQFLNSEITPRFPDGLTVYDARQIGDSEPGKVVSLVFEETAKNQQLLNEITAAYRQKFQQTVRQAANADIAIGFGQSEDLIQNDVTPELIQVDLYFGRNIGTTGRVTEQQFRQFLSSEITPRFPDGLTTYSAKGQFRDSENRLIREPSKVVSLIFADTEQNEQSINAIIDAYKQKFQQESVLEVVNEAVEVGFGQGEDIIDNDPIPEQIQVDLYFGRNIGTTGRVTEQQFAQFLDEQVTPRFADSLTVYDAKGQFLDSSNQLIREPSKVVSLIVEDTQGNEQAINAIIDSYKQQFQQESVLEVVDETIGISLGTAAYHTALQPIDMPLFTSQFWLTAADATDISFE